ncbi:class I SAM-dependent methyltransferase [Hyphomicrobium sp. 99]|uniref:class I SAM-dependent methyltransferase n=1 Tax=Hyphomicrobium sp. 99 TaxID=1163419 RepID=UPI0005F773E5|nr:class I SAM-dependent methyltransferase [Hyphomicrobium sp. 99]
MLHIDDIKYTKLRSRRKALGSDTHELVNVPKIRSLNSSPEGQTASAYNYVGNDYTSYADGNVDKLNPEPAAAAHRFAHADTIVWQAVRSALDELRKSGASEVRVLDAGCGPGIWTRRIADYANHIGLAATVVGFDISTTQLEIARKETERYLASFSKGPKPTLEFQERDLSKALPWAAGSFQLVLCNYTVLNHLTKHAVPAAISELCRVSTGCVIATLRAVGSGASACIIGMEHVREYRHDPARGHLALTLDDGSQHRLPMMMYSAQALEAMFLPHAEVVDLRAMDLFVNRFAADENWTSSLLDRLPDRPSFLEKLKEMEEGLCRLPGWIDHGTHVLIVAKPRSCGSGAATDSTQAPADSSVITSFAEFLSNKS